VTDIDNAAGPAPAGQGMLAQVIATRGGLAAPEAPFVIEHREALIYMLCEAAELEHGIMCQYLFAAFSLKQSPGEGLSEAELAATARWRKQISHVAAQEMLHLALVQNLLSSIGAAPHLSRPNLPAPASHYPAGVQLALLPFGERALRHFMFLERPEGMDLEDADGLAAVGRATPLLNERDIVPRGQDFATVGHLYRSIEAGFAHLSAKYGEDWLFTGPPRAQATAAQFGWPELVAVTGLASAQQAIEEILEQGEGPRGHWKDAHFGQFVGILDEYQQLRAANPGFDPVRPVMAANVRQPERDVELPLIGDALTARVTDLFNVGYEILLQTLERFFAHTEESDAQLKTLADTTIGLMLRVIKPLGDLITTLPVGEAYPGMTAGPSFELFYESDYLMPHQEAAWALLAERLDEAAWLCGEIQSGRGKRVAGQLEPVLAAMREMSRTLAVQLPAGSAHARLAAAPATLEQAELDALVARADALASGAAGTGAGPSAGLGGLLGTAHAIVVASASGQGCDSREQALIVPRLVESVLRPLAGALSRPPAGPAETAAAAGHEVSAMDHGTPAAGRVWQAARAATTLRVRLGRAGTCPPELAEATAALQDLACRLAPPAEAAAHRAELWTLQAGLPAGIGVAADGPYLVTNVPRLVDHLGSGQQPAPQLALCRCGGSAIKPYCDGTHARNGFSGAKDPKRVPDRRDSYPGQELTILDNRGICQHSGLCTDRLPTAFRTSAEPFVAPGGGRMDEIIRAVRDCPSGALSFAIDGREAREQADWGNTREAAIEVTKDGPYRITGGIAVTGADGSPAARAQGASLEHCALCRCGHSQNKPFCSGMHWYVGFTDPVPPPGREPTLFQHAGGLPQLTRMTRLLYGRHVPADPLLAPLFAQIPPGEAARLAGWIGEAFGGPRYRGDELGGPPLVIGCALAAPMTAEQRARWAGLIGRAAQEAGLPADPQFRAAFSAYIEFGSEVAMADAPPAGAQPELAHPATWDWGPAGPPQAATPATAGGDGQQPALPGPGETVTFAAHIKPLFREHDRQSMSFAFDLWSAEGVRQHATDILPRLQDGSMPCDGPWPAERIEVFQRWTETGMQP
jgi:CDGSH-type Zn-finger protein/truncated hemoglobin YjbI